MAAILLTLIFLLVRQAWCEESGVLIKATSSFEAPKHEITPPPASLPGRAWKRELGSTSLDICGYVGCK